MKEINIKEMQKIETEMLKSIDKIFKENKITYYMSCGSCLGAVRHNGPIPWDTDMDISVPVNLLDKAVACLKKSLPTQFRVHDYDSDHNYLLVFPRIALKNTSSDFLHIDIFPLIGIPDNDIEQIKFYKKVNQAKKTYKRKNFRRYIAHPNIIKNIIGKLIEIFCSPFSTKKVISNYNKLIRTYDYDKAKYVSETPFPYEMKSIFYKNVFGKAVYFKYDEIQVPIPEKYEYYLTKYYDEYLEYPSKEEINRGLNYTIMIADSDYDAIKQQINSNK